MDVRTYFIYRLFDAEYPTITRYVGCTIDAEFRLKQHCCPKTGTGLVRPWAAWISGIHRVPQMEILETLECELKDARASESRNIDIHATDNPWLLNSKQWRDDKLAHGVPRHVVNAYQLAVSSGKFEFNFCLSHPLGTISQHLEKAYPRLRIFHYRYLSVPEAEVVSS